MSVRSVHWHEGMLLGPHQMQLGERFNAEQLQRQCSWDLPHHWGLRSLDWSAEELVNERFVVRALRARFRDGTSISLPEDGSLASLDLRPGFAREDSLMIYVGLPVLQMGKTNAAERLVHAGAADTTAAELPPEVAETRYFVDTQELEDENGGGDGQSRQVRSFNVKLLLSAQDLAGYDLLPLARAVKGGKADASPRLDVTYIPPLLACDAWAPMQAGILQSIYDRFGKKMDLLSKQVIARGISFDTQNPGDNLLLSQLHALNQGHSTLNLLAFADGVHPFQAYLELCRFAGQLAVFGESRRVPNFPRYDHDDLGGCFYAVQRYLESIPISEPVYEERPFIGQKLCMQVQLEPAWLEPAWDMYVGAHSTLPPEECVRMLTREGLLNMKIGSALNVDTIYTGGYAGLQFVPSPQPPRVLPMQPDLVYFQVNRTSQREEWEKVRKCLTLAIRLNPNQLPGARGGNIDGQRELLVQAGGKQPAHLRLTLYLIRREA